MIPNHLLPLNPVADACLEWHFQESLAQGANAAMNAAATFLSTTHATVASLSPETVLTAALIFSFGAAIGVLANTLNHVGHQKVVAAPAPAAEDEVFRDAA